MYQQYLIDTKHGSGKAKIIVYSATNFAVNLCDLELGYSSKTTIIKINNGEMKGCLAHFYLWTDGQWHLGHEFKWDDRARSYSSKEKSTEWDRRNSLRLDKANGKWNDPPSVKARDKAIEILTEIARDWAPKNQALLNEGERQKLQEQINDAKKEAAKLYEQFSEQQKLIQKYTKALKAVPNA